MIIKNNSARIHQFDTVGEHKPFTLIPGLNTVDEKAWEVHAKAKTVQHYLDEEVFVVVEGPAADKAEKGSLADYKDKEAIKMVKETFNVELLEEWRSNEKRGAVLKALSAQLDKLAKVEYRGKAEEEEKA